MAAMYLITFADIFDRDFNYKYWLVPFLSLVTRKSHLLINNFFVEQCGIQRLLGVTLYFIVQYNTFTCGILSSHVCSEKKAVPINFLES